MNIGDRVRVIAGPKIGLLGAICGGNRGMFDVNLDNGETIQREFEQLEVLGGRTTFGFNCDDASLLHEAWGMLQSEGVEHTFPYSLERLLELSELARNIWSLDFELRKAGR